MSHPGWELDALEFDTIWHQAEPESQPFPLRAVWAGDTGRQRAQLRRQAVGRLRDRGLLHGGDLDRDLAACLELLRGFHYRVESLWTAPELGPHVARTVVAMDRQVAVYAEQPPEPEPTTTIVPIDPDEAAAAVLQSLPPGESGPGEPIFLDVTALGQERDEDPADGDPRRYLVQVGHGSNPELDRFNSIVGARPLAGGQLSISSRSYRRGNEPVAAFRWFDTPDGRRYLLHRDRRQDRVWLNLLPGSYSRALELLDELLGRARESAQ